MEPYSYDLFASENLPALIWGALIFLAASAIGGLALIPLGRRDFLAWLTFVLCVAVGGLIGWGIGRDIIANNSNADRLSNLIEQTDDLYGVQLTEEQAEDLAPPLGTPVSSYKEFGRTTVEFMGSQVPVALVWNEGVLFYAVEGTGSSLPTKEQMTQQTEQQSAEVTPEPTPAPSE